MDRLSVNSIIRPSVRLDIRLLGLPFVRSFAFLVCSVVPPLAQFFLQSMGINML